MFLHWAKLSIIFASVCTVMAAQSQGAIGALVSVGIVGFASLAILVYVDWRHVRRVKALSAGSAAQVRVTDFADNFGAIFLGVAFTATVVVVMVGSPSISG